MKKVLSQKQRSVNPEDLVTLDILVAPKREEQVKIATYFDSLDRPHHSSPAKVRRDENFEEIYASKNVSAKMDSQFHKLDFLDLLKIGNSVSWEI
ncbi:MAG: hypothetical protein ACLTS6_03865 [Anaerobutyricum sp.]